MSAAIARRRYLTSFDAQRMPNLFTHVLVLGGGVAGLRAALQAAQSCEVLIATKDALNVSASAWAQGGVAAAVAPDDSPDAHARDTLDVGCGLCEAETVRRVAGAGPGAIRELLDWGARLDHQGATLQLGREGGHSKPRIVHALGDATGAEVVRTLIEQARGHPRIRLFERCIAIDLLTHDGAVMGVSSYHPKFGHQLIWATTTILATGGAGCVYRETTNPPVATGDGLAMALRAGAVLRDVEMVQFHPTTLYIAGAARTLITEAARGEGAYLCDREGRRFMPQADPRAELAPRDVVSRAIFTQIRERRVPCAYLDMRHLPQGRVAQRFPGLAGVLKQFGIDPHSQLIPIRPAAHYMVGGVGVDLQARSSLPGLLACGEVASSGLHGANRLASNSLLEGLVFGKVAGEVAADAARGAGRPPCIPTLANRTDPPALRLDLDDIRNSVRSLMDRMVGIEREGDELHYALGQIEFWARYLFDGALDHPAAWETQNLLTTAWAITAAAATRKESRGVHSRRDFPDRSDAWCVHNELLCDGREMRWSTRPIGSVLPGAKVDAAEQRP